MGGYVVEPNVPCGRVAITTAQTQTMNGSWITITGTAHETQELLGFTASGMTLTRAGCAKWVDVELAINASMTVSTSCSLGVSVNNATPTAANSMAVQIYASQYRGWIVRARVFLNNGDTIAPQANAAANGLIVSAGSSISVRGV